MDLVTLTPHQREAVEWTLHRIEEHEPILSILGHAGSGKTTLVLPLATELRRRGILVAVGTPTHRAAHILRSKGVDKVETVYAHATIPYFKADYALAIAWLGGQVCCHWKPEDLPHPNVTNLSGPDLPWLVWTNVEPNLEEAYDLLRLNTSRSPKRRLSSIGVNGNDHFDCFEPRPCSGVLIVDEASMIGTDLLKKCTTAFAQVILVGDPGQLPPINDTSVLETVPGFRLTEIHRQAADSPILQLAERARNGERFWEQGSLQVLSEDLSRGEIHDVMGIPAEVLRASPLIVFNNRKREKYTHQIRKALGYEKRRLYVGEPLVCRSTHDEDRAIGFYNNGLFWIVDVDAHDPRRVTVRGEDNEETIIDIHLEELEGVKVSSRRIPFRFGYVITGHTAQGSEWPTVYIMTDAIRDNEDSCRVHKKPQEAPKWRYTVITRAKQVCCFVRQPTFYTAQEIQAMESKPFSPPTAPFVGMPSTEQTAVTPSQDPFSNTALPLETPDSSLLQPSVLPPDDIPEPQVPAEALQPAQVVHAQPAMPLPGTTPSTLPPGFNEHEALLNGFCQHLQARMQNAITEQYKEMNRAFDDSVAVLRQWVDKIVHTNEHANYQMSDALLKLQQGGLQVATQSEPYVAEVKALSKDGYMVTFRCAKLEANSLLDELEAILGYLKSHGYQAIPEVSYS